MMPLVLFALAIACSQDVPTEPMHGPPMSIGTVCVDATPAGAEVVIAGQKATERCTTVTTSYTASVEVVVSAPGHKTHTESVGLVGDENTLTIKLEADH